MISEKAQAQSGGLGAAPQEKCFPLFVFRMGLLYISFGRPQKATTTEMTEDGILLRYNGKNLVGITILDASARTE